MRNRIKVIVPALLASGVTAAQDNLETQADSFLMSRIRDKKIEITNIDYDNEKSGLYRIKLTPTETSITETPTNEINGVIEHLTPVKKSKIIYEATMGQIFEMFPNVSEAEKKQAAINYLSKLNDGIEFDTISVSFMDGDPYFNGGSPKGVSSNGRIFLNGGTTVEIPYSWAITELAAEGVEIPKPIEAVSADSMNFYKGEVERLQNLLSIAREDSTVSEAVKGSLEESLQKADSLYNSLEAKHNHFIETTLGVSAFTGLNSNWKGLDQLVLGLTLEMGDYGLYIELGNSREMPTHRLPRVIDEQVEGPYTARTIEEFRRVQGYQSLIAGVVRDLKEFSNGVVIDAGLGLGVTRETRKTNKTIDPQIIIDGTTYSDPSLTQSGKGEIYHGNVQVKADVNFKTKYGRFGLGGSAGLRANGLSFYKGVNVSYAPAPKTIPRNGKGK